ncbi:MAG: ABC transporter substrate-binding protein [Deltaproteobacteria bacterium]|nr:ABC transporter substrate-binding protein [Deltaproteobacteria bacterium]
MKHAKTIIVVAVLLAFLSGGAASAGSDKINFGYRLTMTSMVFMQGQYWKKYGLDLNAKLFSTGIEMREGLITSKVNFGEVGITPTSVALTKAGKYLYVVGVGEYGGGKYRMMVRKDSPYKSIKDLVGKKVAIKIGSGCYVAFLLYLDKYGLNEKQFEVLNAGDTESIAAMEEGSVEAVIYWEPIPSVLEAKGLARELANFADVVRNPVFLITQRMFADKHRSALLKTLAAFSDAQDLIMNDRNAAAKLVVEMLAAHGQKAMGADIYARAMSHSTYALPLKPMLIEDLKENWQTLRRKGKIKGAEPDWDSILRPDIAEAAMALKK